MLKGEKHEGDLKMEDHMEGHYVDGNWVEGMPEEEKDNMDDVSGEQLDNVQEDEGSN
jgi:hypothetical protein